MCNKKIERLSDKQRARDGGSVQDAIKRAKQHIRNVGIEDLKEPERFASGDMKGFLENPEKHEWEGDGEREND